MIFQFVTDDGNVHNVRGVDLRTVIRQLVRTHGTVTIIQITLITEQSDAA